MNVRIHLSGEEKVSKWPPARVICSRCTFDGLKKFKSQAEFHAVELKHFVVCPNCKAKVKLL